MDDNHLPTVTNDWQLLNGGPNYAEYNIRDLKKRMRKIMKHHNVLLLKNPNGSVRGSLHITCLAFHDNCMKY